MIFMLLVFFLCWGATRANKNSLQFSNSILDVDSAIASVKISTLSFYVYLLQSTKHEKKKFPFSEKMLATLIPSVIDEIFIFFAYRKGEQLWHHNS